MPDPLLTITAYGRPAPQGSKRHVGGGVMVESSKALKPWREAVKTAALDARGEGWTPIDAPLVVSMVFTMPKPASAPKRRRTWPMRTPDLSKLIRATEDALTDAGIWCDDARVVAYTDTAKVYPGEGDDALVSPGVVIRIWDAADLDPQWIDTVARVLWDEIYARVWADVDEPPVRNGMLADAETIVAALAPLIAAAERERIARAIEADQHERNGCCACTVDAERHAAIARRPETA